MTVVNNQETNEGDNVFYVNIDGSIYEAIIKNIVEKDGNHHADLEAVIDGFPTDVLDVPHNTSREKHSWNHPMNPKERESHYHPDFYGSIA